MANNTIKGFKIKGVPHVLDATYLSGTTKEELLASGGSGVVVSATTAQNADAIGNVEKYSGVYGDKQRDGLYFKSAVPTVKVDGVYVPNEAVMELNEKGNFTVESLAKHLNLESAQGVQIKPTTTIILDSSRRIENNKGNEINIEAKFDDYKDRTNPEYSGKDGYDEEYAELKIKSRNLDLRCHQHGGIALQIAGKDGHGNENKIKFESDRTSLIGSTGVYNGEGGKGLEFGTFNNNHASLYCGDYRFKGDAQVYGVTRGALTQTGTKIDYPTQGDDFKDIVDSGNTATWNEIIDAAKKCKNLDETITAEVARQALSGNVDASVFVTKSEVEDVVASAMTELHIDTTGLAKETWVLDQNYIKQVSPEITLNQYALQHAKIGKKKGNFAIDVTGKYTWEETGPKSATTVDEHNNVIENGDRVGDFDSDVFFEDPNKVYYKAQIETVLADNTPVLSGTIVYNPACMLDISGVDTAVLAIFEMASGDTAFYEDVNKYVFQGAKKAYKYDGTQLAKKTILDPATLSPEEIAYYESKCPVYDEDGETILVEGEGWTKINVWKKSTLWSKNELNINLESDSKIKFAGKKIETVWTYEENGEDVDHKMDEISLSTTNLVMDSTEVNFERKITKNGEFKGQDTEIVYTYTNNVSDSGSTRDFNAFKANYMNAHGIEESAVTQEQIEEMQTLYNKCLADGTSYEIRVKINDLLGLVARVADLERRVALLEGQTPEQN